ncbi:MAG: indole-3-glycerol phosphate synthase TrpC [Parvularculales bacterium]
MAAILDKITDYKREEIAYAKQSFPLKSLRDVARQAPPVRPFREALLKAVDEKKVALIAEIKKASPTAGIIREDFNPTTIARAYEAGGASCLSVLTDTPSFQGSPDFLKQARGATSLPVLRKDFMLDPYQIVESRALGADCVLIIMAMISDDKARLLYDEASKWGMAVLAEVHDEPELTRALNLTNAVIGINNRNLKTFVTDIAVTERLAPSAPTDRLLVSESGIKRPNDIDRLMACGAHGFLVGESLMRADDIEAATHMLLSCSHE